VVIEDFLQTCTMRSGNIELLEGFLRIAAWAVGKDTLGSGMD